MAKRYQFVKTVVVAGVKYDAGAVVYGSAVPAGYLESCLQVGHVVEYKSGDAAADQFEKAMTASPDPPPSTPLVGPPGETAKPTEAKKPAKK